MAHGCVTAMEDTMTPHPIYKDTDEVLQSCFRRDYYWKPDVRNRGRERYDNGRTWLIQAIRWRWTVA